LKFNLLTAKDFAKPALPPSRDATRQTLLCESPRAIAMIETWPGYAPTPLVMLRGLAKETNVAAIKLKNEAGRFGLGSFKALGGAYAISRLLLNQLNAGRETPVGLDFLLSDKGRALNSKVILCTATDGNHGRSVAWGAQMFGCNCVIFIHEHVSEARETAIASYGARVVRVAGNYDDSVREAKTTAAREGWTVISDTSYEGYRDIPLDVMAGYAVMVCEAITQWGSANLPTHVFLQTGVGAMAAAVAVQLQEAYGDDCPKIILVDPINAACFYDSLKHGTPTVTLGGLETVMAGLACGEISDLAWDILYEGVDAVVAIDDDAAKNVMRVLAAGNTLDAPMVAGESGASGLAAFLALAHDDAARTALGITAESRLLFFSTEGATDPEIYQAIVGKAPQQIAEGA